MKEYEINIDPRILELLGPNLYTNIYYVLAELIANAFDADAKNVYIIANPDNIRVEDDGHGMSYDDGEVKKYLNVAGESRTSEKNSYTRSGNRRKMGRKGVGKLAALSVSESVDIMTVSNGEKSGFVLTRRPEGNKLEAIKEEDIQFDFVETHGTAIVMKQPEYRLHTTLNAVKRNLLKIFPMVSSDFQVHILRGKEKEIIADFDSNIMRELSTLITLGEQFSTLSELVPRYFQSRHTELVESKDSFTAPMLLKNKEDKELEYTLEVVGWIGTYTTSRGRKAEMTDFPDNFISLFANGKLGEFNILPNVGSNKLNEVYVVGQLHIDLFELSELADMALSNRQGYKSDDLRYEKVRDFIRSILLPDILKKRELYSDLTKAKKKRKVLEDQKKDEAQLRKVIDKFRNNISQGAAKTIFKLGAKTPIDVIEAIIKDSINNNSPELGLKSVVDSQKKKILISQTYSDKPLSDIVYNMLNYNNVPSDDILYTNCDDEICRVPEGVSVYEYLRDFFVESYSTQKIFVLFITSENSKQSWGAITEVGASWITQIDHKIFNITPFRPEHPLDDESQWHNTDRNGTELTMSALSSDIFCQKIEKICELLGYRMRTRDENKAHLATLVSIN